MKKKIFSILFLIVAAFTVSACQKSNEPVYEFSGFEIKETVTAESGTYYELEQPEVKVGDKNASLLVVVKNGDMVVPHDNFKVYLDCVGTFKITYTASYDGQSVSKTTVITAKDTTKPVVANTFVQAIPFHTAFNPSAYVNVKDASKIKSVEYAFTKEDGSALPNGAYNEETKQLFIEDETIHRVKMIVSATDVYDNESEETFILNFIPAASYASFDFDWFETDATEAGGIQVITSDINTVQMQVKEEAGEKYLLVTVTTTVINQYVTVNFPENLIGDYSKFDYVDVEMMLSCTFNGGNGGLVNAEFSATPLDKRENLFATYKDQWLTYTYAGDTMRASIEKNKGLGLMFKPWGAQTITIAVKSIVGRHDKKALVSDGDVLFDFETTLGLKATEVKDVTYNGVSVANPAEFKPNKSGELKFTICKAGYKETQYALQLKVNPVSVDNGNGNDNDYEWDWE